MSNILSYLNLLFITDVFDDIIMLILWGMDIVMYFPDVKERLSMVREN